MKIGVSRSNLSQIEIGRNTPSIALINQIATKCNVDVKVIFEMINSPDKLLPDLLPKLLPNNNLTAPLNENSDKGTNNLIADQLKTATQKPNVRQLADLIDSKEDNYTAVPITQLEAAAGKGAINYEHYAQSSKMVKFPNTLLRPGALLAGKIVGDSMEPTLVDGGYIIMRHVERSEYPYITNGTVCMVVTTDGESYVKRLKKERRRAILKSDNPNRQFYPDLAFDWEQIVNIWRVEWYFTNRLRNIAQGYIDEQQEAFSGRMDTVEEQIKEIAAAVKLLQHKS